MTQHTLTSLYSDEAVRLTPNGLHSGLDITIQNVDASAYVYVGGDDTITPSNYGYRISPNNAVSFSLLSHDALYAISDTTDSQVAVITVGIMS